MTLSSAWSYVIYSIFPFVNLALMSDNASQTKKVSCPQCKKLSEYSVKNPYRPFCSERCKLIDLGDWANENYKIPVAPTIDDLETIDENLKPS